MKYVSETIRGDINAAVKFLNEQHSDWDVVSIQYNFNSLSTTIVARVQGTLDFAPIRKAFRPEAESPTFTENEKELAIEELQLSQDGWVYLGADYYKDPITGVKEILHTAIAINKQRQKRK